MALDLRWPEVNLECPELVILVGQREAARVPQHVRMCLSPKLGLDATALHSCAEQSLPW